MRNRGFDRDRDRDDRSGRELGGYRSAHSQDRDDRGRFAGHDDRDRGDVCPNCGYAMSDYGDRGYGYGERGYDGGDRHGIRTSDRYDRDDRGDRDGIRTSDRYDRYDRYDRGDRYQRSSDRDDRERYDDSAGDRPRGMPDEGYSTWGSDRERGYATTSRDTSGWGRDEDDGRRAYR